MPPITRRQFRPGFLEPVRETTKDLQRDPPPTFPVTNVIDNFNRADGSIGGSWTAPLWAGGTPDRGLDISGNTIVRSAAGTASEGSGYLGTMIYGSQEVYATVKDVSATSNGHYLYMCLTNPGTGAPSGYELQIAPEAGLIQFSRRDNGDYVFIKHWSTAIALNDVVGMRLVKGHIYVFLNGVLLGRVADSHYDEGVQGLALDGATASFDNFGGGPIGLVPSRIFTDFPFPLVGNPQTTNFPLSRSVDYFDYTASPLPSPWAGPIKTGDGNLQASLGNAKNSGGGWSSGYRSDVSIADGEMWATIGKRTVVSGTDTGNLYWRGSGGGTASPSGYFIVNPSWDATKVHIYKLVSGTETDLWSASIGSPLNDGDSLGVRFVGSAHEVYVMRAGENWQFINSLTDSSITSAGWVGWAESGVGPELREFGWGGFQLDPVPTPVIARPSAIRAANF